MGAVKTEVRRAATSPATWIALGVGLLVGMGIAAPRLVGWSLDAETAALFGAAIGAAVTVLGSFALIRREAAERRHAVANALALALRDFIGHWIARREVLQHPMSASGGDHLQWHAEATSLCLDVDDLQEKLTLWFPVVADVDPSSAWALVDVQRNLREFASNLAIAKDAGNNQPDMLVAWIDRTLTTVAQLAASLESGRGG